MNHPNPRFSVLFASLASVTICATGVAQIAGLVTRASVDSADSQANDASGIYSNTSIAISADGRFVAFNSRASNLVSGDTNGVPDVFLHDLLTGATERVSVSSSGQEANGDANGQSSFGLSLSSDGKFVGFSSAASNLVAGDTGGKWDAFVRDRANGITERVSVSTSNGSPNNNSYTPVLSADGRFALFDSYASNLVSGDSNGKRDVFVRDRRLGVTRRISVSSSGSQGNGDSNLAFHGNALSADGRYAVFMSAATNLVSGDNNAQVDVFVRDLSSNTTRRASVTNSGGQANGWSGHPSISGDGRFVAFQSYAANLAPPGAPVGQAQIYVRDLVLSTTVCASVSSTGEVANGATAMMTALSSDGRYLVFNCNASNLVQGVAGGYNLYVRDLWNGATTCPLGTTGSGTMSVGGLSISRDGARIVFTSDLSNLVAGDTNAARDVFVVQ